MVYADQSSDGSLRFSWYSAPMTDFAGRGSALGALRRKPIAHGRPVRRPALRIWRGLPAAACIGHPRPRGPPPTSPAAMSASPSSRAPTRRGFLPRDPPAKANSAVGAGLNARLGHGRCRAATMCPQTRRAIGVRLRSELSPTGILIDLIVDQFDAAFGELDPVVLILVSRSRRPQARTAARGAFHFMVSRAGRECARALRTARRSLPGSPRRSRPPRRPDSGGQH
jgi:hypothetical protein